MSPAIKEASAKNTDDFQKAIGISKEIAAEISRVVIGQDEVVKLLLSSVIGGGHAMLVGVPGLAKTLLVETVGAVCGLDAKRIQFTPDLMPADITGSEVLEHDDAGKKSFRFLKGPVFCQLLMADEINRASPRTQAALLQAMQEHKVTIAGHNYDLPSPFHVIATRNPIEQEGTYPLPEAQLDRFLMEIEIGYPDASHERSVLLATTGAEKNSAKTVATASDILHLQSEVREMPIGQKLLDDITRFVRETRPETSSLPEVRKYVEWGAGVRAGQAMLLAAKSYALISGRFSPVLEDVIRVAPSVLRHRVIMNYAARSDGFNIDRLIETVLSRIA